MMNEPMTTMTLAGLALLGLGIMVAALLKGWEGWLSLKRMELAGHEVAPRSAAMERIEIADLKERIRKLESIAACVDL
jgi:hypothetical protein